MIRENNERIMRKVHINRESIWQNEEVMLDDAEVVIFTIGSTARSARFAVNELRKSGVKAGLLRPLTIWPFPDKAVGEISSRVKAIIVPEMNLGQMTLEVERCARGRCAVEGLFRVDGEPITPSQIFHEVRKYL